MQQVERDAGDATDARRSRDVRRPVDPPPDDVGAPSLFFERPRRFGDEELKAGIGCGLESCGLESTDDLEVLLKRLQSLRRGSENPDPYTPNQLNRTSLGVIHQQPALADGLALPSLIDEAWEEATSGATESESRPRPPTEGEENHASSGGELLQPSAAEYHEVVDCTKSYAKQLDRERESCESIDFTKHNEGEDGVNFAEQDDLLPVAGKSDDQSVTSLSQWLGDDYINEEGDIESIGREPPHSTSVPISSPPEEKRKSIEPSDGDVLYGRGGNANTHPGNIRFREKARELLPRYLRSKEDKKPVSVELMESVTRDGHRFLEKSSDGKWYKVVNPRIKASQAFRDALRVLLKDVASMSIEWGQIDENVVGDLDPTNDD